MEIGAMEIGAMFSPSWLRSLKTAFRATPPQRSWRRLRQQQPAVAKPSLEPLEERIVPALTFSQSGGTAPPVFGAETASNNMNLLYGNIPIYLIFQAPVDHSSFNYDSPLFGYDSSVTANQIITAVKTMLSSTYLSGLDQYYPSNTFGGTNAFPPPQPYVKQSYLSYYTLPTTFTDGSNDSDINNLVSASIADNNGGTPGNPGLPEPDDTMPIGLYAVFTPAGYKIDDPNPGHVAGGAHGSGSTGDVTDPDDANDLVLLLTLSAMNSRCLLY
jgi:hypothetical protein